MHVLEKEWTCPKWLIPSLLLMVPALPSDSTSDGRVLS